MSIASSSQSLLSFEHFEPTPFRTRLFNIRQKISKYKHDKKYTINSVLRCNEAIRDVDSVARQKLFLLIIQYHYEINKDYPENIPYNGMQNMKNDEISFDWNNLPFELQALIINFVNGIKK